MLSDGSNVCGLFFVFCSTLTSHGSFEPISPQHSAPSAIEEEDEDDDLPDEDNCLVHDPWFHWFCTSKWFLLFVSLYALVQSMIINGIFPAVVSTVQHRYNQTSTTMGYLASKISSVSACFVCLSICAQIIPI
jgi:hypothetical protein